MATARWGPAGRAGESGRGLRSRSAAAGGARYKAVALRKGRGIMELALSSFACRSVALACGAALGASLASAQTTQVVRPPVAQAWIDIATFSGLGMPAGMAGGNPMAVLGSLFGGGAQKVPFGMTQSFSGGRFVDVTLATRRNPQLAEAEQQVPAGFMSPALQLRAPPQAPAPPAAERDDEVMPEREAERPKGRLLLYWGCGTEVRPGQPKVLDMASASATDLAQFFQSRRATQRGAHQAAGRPSWPNATDGRPVPAQASLAGEHAFSGAGVPDGFRFTVGAAQDFMPPLAVEQQDQGGSTLLSWASSPQVRGTFIAGMGARGENEMVIWTSSELPDIGFGLVDYQTNAAVERWVREKVLLAPAVTRCSVPRGVFTGDGAMLRSIAYGPELNLAHPPRPSDPRTPWEPEWAVKLRVKAVHTAMLGMPSMGRPGPGGDPDPAAADKAERPSDKKPEKKPSALDILRGVLGR